MKIIFVDKNQQFRLIPDSALLLKHRPFFCPDYVENLHAKIAFVVKINRLGKYIQEKFASTYYDEIGFAINFYDKKSLESQVQNGLPWERATCFDGSFALSEFLAKTDYDPYSLPLTFSKNRGDMFRLHIVPPDTTAQIISEISTFMTLKIGDYIAIELDEITSAPFEINDVLTLSSNEKDLVRVVVK